MSRASMIRRPFAVLACILQLFVGGALGLADAWLDGAGAAPAAAHVEEPGSQSCPPVHTDECAVCRQLTALYGPSRPSGIGTPRLHSATEPEGDAGLHASARLTRSLLPRAPPLA